MEKINLKQFSEMLYAGAKAIISESNYINDLNVFPVPDGDTGVNLNMTLSKAIDEIKCEKHDHIGDFAKSFARKTLLNARGNSGIIMSRIIKGLTLPLEDCATEISITKLQECFIKSCEIAYSAVGSPTEGTMLTVTRFIKEQIEIKKAFDSIEELLQTVHEAAGAAVVQSPNLLPVLKENNTIDSGAYACFKFYQGFLTYLGIPFKKIDLFSQISISGHKNVVKNKFVNFEDKANFGYCCEFVVNLKEKVAPHQRKANYNYEEIQEVLNRWNADSVVIVQEDNLLKIHAHLIEPYQLLKLGQRYGEFISIKIENMSNQFKEHTSKTILKSESKNFVTDKKSVIFGILPTQEIKDFIKSKYKLDYFWCIELQGEPNVQNIVEEIQQTKAEKIYGLASTSSDARRFKNAEQFVNKKQSCSLIKTSSFAAVLNVISHYKKEKSKWWNLKILEVVAKRATDFSLEKKEDTNKKFYYSGKENRKILFRESDQQKAIKILVNGFIEHYEKHFYKKSSAMTIIYNSPEMKSKINLICKFIKEKHKIQCYSFLVINEKKLVTLGLIKQ